jgi:hypothetical protein
MKEAGEKKYYTSLKDVINRYIKNILTRPLYWTMRIPIPWSGILCSPALILPGMSYHIPSIPCRKHPLPEGDYPIRYQPDTERYGFRGHGREKELYMGERSKNESRENKRP